MNVTNPPSGEYFEAKRNVVVMNGLDVGEASSSREDKEEFKILYLGLLCEPKGVMELVKTARLLKNAHVNCEFVMVGAWESVTFQRTMEYVMDQAGVRDMFLFSGVKKGDEKWRSYADADVFFFPTHHATETFGLVLIEAMAFGLPIVTTRWRGVPHVVGEDGSAFLCDVRNPDQFAQALEDLWKDKDLRERMGRVARQRYKKYFTRQKFVSAMEDVFEEVLKS